MRTTRIMATLLLAMPFTSIAQRVEFQKLIAEDVRCAGNATTSCEFIRSQVHVAPGDALSEEELANAQLRLSSLRNFESVDVHLEKGSVRDSVVVVIDVKERDPIVAEVLAGASYRHDAVSSVFAGRIANQNLFGTGKVADVAVIAVTPLSHGEAMNEHYEIALRYADPNLFDSSRYFAVASLGFRNQRYEDDVGNFSQFDGAYVDARVGRRFFDFSYLTLGVQYRPNQNYSYGDWREDGTFHLGGRESDVGLNLIYGWNSEDDLYFPTRGSSFHLGFGYDFGSGSHLEGSHLQFRKTWRVIGGFFAIRVGGGPNPEYRTTFEESQLLSVNYSRNLQNASSLVRGRWYVQPGIDVMQHDQEGRGGLSVGLKVGVKLDWIGFGIVDLFISGSRDSPR